MKQKSQIWIKGAVFLLSTAMLAILPMAVFSQSASPALTKEQLADLVTPSVVRVANHFTGTATIPAFDVDLNTLAAVLQKNQPPLSILVDTYVTGSGFVVNSHGYIITNSHVVASDEIEQSMISDLWLQTIQRKMVGLSQAQSQEVQNNLQKKYGGMDDSDTAGLVGQILGPLIDASQFQLANKLVVLNPASSQATLKDLVDEGYPAKIVSFNKNYAGDQRDVALLSIDQDNLPVLNLGTAANVTTGQNVYIVSFPSTATFSSHDFLQPSFTQGVISAVKKSVNGDFNIFQTDAKISTGSSGSPLLDSNGKVEGIITFESVGLDTGQGDNFAFALPVALVNNLLDDQNVSNTPDNFSKPFLAGLALTAQNHCRQAISQFESAKQVNADFLAAKTVDKYVSACQDMIDAGKSIDSNVDQAWHFVANVGTVNWIVLGALILVLLIFIWAFVAQSSRMKREETAIVQLEHMVEQEEEQLKHDEELLKKSQATSSAASGTGQSPATISGSPGSDTVPIPKPGPINQELLMQVAQARANMLADNMILESLVNTGWDRDEVIRALAHKAN